MLKVGVIGHNKYNLYGIGSSTDHFSGIVSLNYRVPMETSIFYYVAMVFLKDRTALKQLEILASVFTINIKLEARTILKPLKSR